MMGKRTEEQAKTLIESLTEMQEDGDERQCRVCGCTDDHACPGGCYWAEDDLCSRCAEKLREGESGE